MMDPGVRMPSDYPFSVIRTLLSPLEITETAHKLCRLKLGQVMKQPLPVQSHRKTSLRHQFLVVKNGLQMSRSF